MSRQIGKIKGTNRPRWYQKHQRSWYRLQSLDTQYYGSWPFMVKLSLIAMLMLVIALVAYLLPIRAKQQQLVAIQDQQQVLLASYRQKAIQAATQQAHVEQTKHAQQQLDQLSQQLSIDSQVPELMEAVNTVALSSGVRLQDISLAETIEQTLYIQQPIDMVLVGGYHNLGLFLSGLAALPRLITIQGFAVTNSNPLIMDPQSLSLVLHTTAYQSIPNTAVDSNSDSEPSFLEQEQ